MFQKDRHTEVEEQEGQWKEVSRKTQRQANSAETAAGTAELFDKKVGQKEKFNEGGRGGGGGGRREAKEQSREVVRDRGCRYIPVFTSSIGCSVA